MQVQLINVVDKEAEEDSDFIPSDGLAYVIEFEGRRILFDSGDKGTILMHNMNLLNIDPNTLEFLVLSHSHYDHTFGIEALLDARKEVETLRIIAHPHAFQRRKAKFPLILKALLKYRMYNFGFPKLPKSKRKRLVFEPTTKPFEITPYLKTTGEIAERKEIACTIDDLKRKEGRRYVKDDLLDDLSLILKTKEGIVVICGCGHSGVLNICERAKELFPNQEIKTIIGGTHLVALTEEKDLEYVAKKLEEEYNKPLLYFSHCTGKRAIKYMTNYFGKEIVRPFKIGDILTFEVDSIV